MSHRYADATHVHAIDYDNGVMLTVVHEGPVLTRFGHPLKREDAVKLLDQLAAALSMEPVALEESEP